MRPVIGLTTYREQARWGTWDRQADLLPARYADSVLRAGGVPVLVPPIEGIAAELVRTLDGLVLSGGADIEPSRYGATPHPSVTVVRPDRDAAEIEAFHAALDADLPVLGVCRGLQVMNVALGGDLVQHLPDVVVDANHRGGPSEFARQRVALDAGSRLRDVLGDATDVDCYHHQALARLGRDLRVVAHADDGTIEAVEVEGRRFVVGVQWHPEESDDVRLFTALVDAATRARAAR